MTIKTTKKTRKRVGIKRISTKHINYSSVPKIMREILAVYEVLRRLGFKSDNIFTAYYGSGIYVVLKESPVGETIFTITIDEDIINTITEEDFHSMYIKYSALWNGTEPGMSDKVRQKIFNESIIISKRQIESLVCAMQDKGVYVPYLDQKMYN